MIIHQAFFTYKNDFPLLLRDNQRVAIPEPYDLNNIFKNLILELSKISLFTKFTYITRHTNDNIPEEILSGFKNKFPHIVDLQRKGNILGIPTVWFTCYAEKEEEVYSILTSLNKKGIKYFTNGPTQYNSLEQIPPDQNYTTSALEAKTFPKFLHQVSQIGIDLLKDHESVDFLAAYKPLEWRQHPDKTHLANLQNELEVELSQKSSFYCEKIKKDTLEKAEFCQNFQKAYIKDGAIFSWPHFLFNICGI